MREKKAAVAAVGVGAVLVVGIVIYAAARQGPAPSGAHAHEHEGMPAHQEGAHPAGEAAPMGEMHASGEIRGGVRVVEVRARQFEFDPATIAVRQGEQVRLKITSEDVAHGFDLEGYDIDRRLPPGTEQVVEFTAGESGSHHFHCSVYCGEGHDRMHGTLMVLPPETQEHTH